MRELLEVVQKASFVGIIAGGFFMSHKSGLKNLWWISLLVCMGTMVLDMYWVDISAFFEALFSWLGWGAVALLLVFICCKVIRRLIGGKRM